MDNNRRAELLLVAHKNDLLPQARIPEIFSSFTAADLLSIVKKSEYYFNLLALDALVEKHPDTSETQQAILLGLQNSRDNVREHALGLLTKISNDFSLQTLLERLSSEHSEALIRTVRTILTESKNPNLNQLILQKLETAPAYVSAKLLIVLQARIGAEELANLLQARTENPA